jgi:cellulose synthase/poly-beta-1,6-N-acetylglucosamine synthase-like glycosyltransferase
LFFQLLFFALSVALTLFFFLYGLNQYYLLSASRRYVPPALPATTGNLPPVAVHLPVYNEKYVVRRLVDACARMATSYGIEKVNILILDDSTDDTTNEVNHIASEYAAKGFHIKVIHRDNRQGFKAGALEAALEKTPEEFIAIFDADFIPEVDFLNRTLPYFLQDKDLGIVQSRWCHINRDFNLLSRAVAIAIDIHFVIEQPARYARGLFQNFNGSGGVLRKEAIKKAGGWQADTLAEDLDLSYRMELLGYKLVYLRDLDSPAEVPATVPSLRQQQGRWANGSLRTAKKILPSLFRKDGITFGRRVQAFIHLTGYIIHPLMTISFVLTCIATFTNLNNTLAAQAGILLGPFGLLRSAGAVALYSFQRTTWEILSPVIFLCTIAPWISSISTLRIDKSLFFRNLASLLVLLLLGFGISLNNTLEAGKALLTNRVWEFTRTPKYADFQNKSSWRKSNYQITWHPTWILEFVFASIGVIAIVFAFSNSNYSVLLILIPFTTAYFFTFFQTVSQSRRGKV